MSDLLDLSSEPATVQLNGTTYNVRKLTLADQARAERMIRDERLNQFLETATKHAFVAAQPAVMGATIGEIMCATILAEDMFKSRANQLYLLAVAMSDEKMDDRQALDRVRKLPPMEIDTLLSLVGYVGGLTVVDKDESGSDPTTPTASSTPSTN